VQLLPRCRKKSNLQVGTSAKSTIAVDEALAEKTPGLLDDRYGEQEYVVDRRLLKAITVIERF
jgi:hypothetical protein